MHSIDVPHGKYATLNSAHLYLPDACIYREMHGICRMHPDLYSTSFTAS